MFWEQNHSHLGKGWGICGTWSVRHIGRQCWLPGHTRQHVRPTLSGRFGSCWVIVSPPVGPCIQRPHTITSQRWPPTSSSLRFNRSYMLHLVSGTSFLLQSVNLIPSQTLLSFTSSIFPVDSPLLSSITPSFFSTNHSHRRLFFLS